MKIIKVSIWFIIFIVLLNVTFNMVSSSNTIENIIGFLTIVGMIFLSYKTKCLTIIKFKRKHGK